MGVKTSAALPNTVIKMNRAMIFLLDLETLEPVEDSNLPRDVFGVRVAHSWLDSLKGSHRSKVVSLGTRPPTHLCTEALHFEEVSEPSDASVPVSKLRVALGVGIHELIGRPSVVEIPSPRLECFDEQESFVVGHHDLGILSGRGNVASVCLVRCERWTEHWSKATRLDIALIAQAIFFVLLH